MLQQIILHFLHKILHTYFLGYPAWSSSASQQPSSSIVSSLPPSLHLASHIYVCHVLCSYSMCIHILVLYICVYVYVLHINICYILNLCVIFYIMCVCACTGRLFYLYLPIQVDFFCLWAYTGRLFYLYLPPIQVGFFGIFYKKREVIHLSS